MILFVDVLQLFERQTRITLHEQGEELWEDVRLPDAIHCQTMALPHVHNGRNFPAWMK